MPSQHNLAVVMPRSEDLGALLARTAGGDEVALAELYDATSSHVYGLALRIVGDRPTAEEVTLDVFLQVWRQAERYDPARGATLGWLLTIARSRAIDRLRASGSRRQVERCQELNQNPGGPTQASAPEDLVGAADRQRLVQHALMRLSPEERQTIELAYFTGLSHSEISSTLGTPLGSVKTRIRTGMIRLRQVLGSTGRNLL